MPQFCQGNVLQLTNALARNAEIFADVFQSLRLSAVEAEPLKDDFFLAAIEHCDQAIQFGPKVFVAQEFKRRLRFLISDNVSKFDRIIGVPYRRVERTRANTKTL